jgi:integrase
MKTTSKGLRKKENGKFVATKYINGKRHYCEFETEREAKKWRKEFHPLLSPQRSKARHNFTIVDQSNGKDKSLMFGDVLEAYQKEFLKSLTTYTQYKKTQRLQRFAPNIVNVPMCVMSPEVITNHLDSLKLLIDKNSRRCNFDKELKDLASIFNWYKENKDFTFVNPVTKVHYKLGKVADIPTKIKDMDMEEFTLFVGHLSLMFQSMAIIMLLWCLRVGEAAAITDDVINLKKKEAWIFNVIVWLKGHPTPKKGTKTGADAKMPITDLIEVEIRKLQANRPKGCKYLFQYKGKPLRYDMI